MRVCRENVSSEKRIGTKLDPRELTCKNSIHQPCTLLKYGRRHAPGQSYYLLSKWNWMSKINWQTYCETKWWWLSTDHSPKCFIQLLTVYKEYSDLLNETICGRMVYAWKHSFLKTWQRGEGKVSILYRSRTHLLWDIE